MDNNSTRLRRILTFVLAANAFGIVASICSAAPVTGTAADVLTVRFRLPAAPTNSPDFLFFSMSMTNTGRDPQTGQPPPNAQPATATLFDGNVALGTFTQSLAILNMPLWVTASSTYGAVSGQPTAVANFASIWSGAIDGRLEFRPGTGQTYEIDPACEVQTCNGPGNHQFLLALFDTQRGIVDATSVPQPVITSVSIATPGAPVLSVDYSTIDFGGQTLGTVSAARSLTVINSGTGPLVIDVVSLSGSNVTDFVIAGTSCNGATLAPAETCFVSVAFSPVALGTRTAMLSIPSNASGSPALVALLGTGITTSSVPIPEIRSISPTSGSVGIPVTIRGKAFGATQRSSYVLFSDSSVSTRATVTSWRDGQINAVAPTGLAGPTQVTVTTPGGTSTGVVFTYPIIFNLKIVQPIPPVLERQDFGLIKPSSAQPAQAFLKVATNEKEKVAGEIQDACYGGAMDAAWRTQRTKILQESLRKLYSGVFKASLGIVSTGNVYLDFLLKLAQEGVGAAIAGDPVPPALAGAVASEAGGYIVAKATNEYLATLSSPLIDLSLDAMSNLLADDGVLPWTLSGSNLRTEGQRSGVWPLTTIEAKLYYNPWNHYTSAIIAATCQFPTGTKKNLYIVTYENVKAGLITLPAAEPRLDTLRVRPAISLN